MFMLTITLAQLSQDAHARAHTHTHTHAHTHARTHTTHTHHTHTHTHTRTHAQDALSSILVARDGFGDMAVSNAIGSNVFDINLGLGLPFLISVCIQKGRPFDLLSEEQRVCSTLITSSNYCMREYSQCSPSTLPSMINHIRTSHTKQTSTDDYYRSNSDLCTHVVASDCQLSVSHIATQ